jgi:hypothetical protein
MPFVKGQSGGRIAAARRTGRDRARYCKQQCENNGTGRGSRTARRRTGRAPASCKDQ